MKTKNSRPGESSVSNEEQTFGIQLLNGETHAMTNEATEDFIGRIREELQNGFGLVPLIGAGFSAPSGVPLVRQMLSYLQRCICMALGAEEEGMRPWNPRMDSWPPFIDRSRAEPPAVPWINQVGDALNLLRQKNPNNPDLAIFQEGFGAMAEWRTALVFLSRLTNSQEATGPGSGRLSLGTPRQEIIDACFREALGGKHPSLNHKMLNALMGLLRIDVILSTNFDDLLERAFEASRNSLEVFEVHLQGGLPDWSAVSRVKALVKLHGSRHSLRADYSLDDDAPEQDKRRFLEYLIKGRYAPSKNRPKPPSQNHILVMGVGAKEKRTCSFIEYAWKNLADFKVYWVCHTGEGVETVKNLYIKMRKEEQLAEGTPQADREKSLVILRHTEIGFLLLHLYQLIRNNVPPSGTVFPTISRVALPPLPPAFRKSRRLVDAKHALSERLLAKLKDFERVDFEGYRVVTVVSDMNVHGVTTACASVFRQIEGDNTCLWIDMNDITSTDNFFEVLLETANFRLGLEHWTPFYVGKDSRPRAEEIQRLASSGDRPWVIFLNARETPGMNAAQAGVKHETNGWIDLEKPPTDNETDLSGYLLPFAELLKELSFSTIPKKKDEHRPRISVVLMCYTKDKKSAIVDDLTTSLKTPRLALDDDSDPDHLSCNQIGVATGAIRWAFHLKSPSFGAEKHDRSTATQRLWFLQALMLFQRSRLPATVWDACVRDEKLVVRYHNLLAWLGSLEKANLIRRKPGGYIWAQSTFRQKMRELFANEWKPAELKQLGLSPAQLSELKKFITGRRAHIIHSRIAAWYEKLLDATGSPASIFEAADHRCRAAEACLKNAFETGTHVPPFVRDQLTAATALLRGNAHLIQTHGYSRGSCRRLEYIRDFLNPDHMIPDTGLPKRLLSQQRLRWKKFTASADPKGDLERTINDLRIVCTEIMRAIAREVGEDRKAFDRQFEAGRLLAGQEEWLEKPPIPSRIPTFRPRDLLAALRKESEKAASEGEKQRAYRNWLRWWRWYGMLRLVSRSSKTGNELSTALYYACKWKSLDSLTFRAHRETLLSAHDPEFSFAIDDLKRRLDELDSDPELRIEILRIMETAAAALLLDEKTLLRVRELMTRPLSFATGPGERKAGFEPQSVFNSALRASCVQRLPETDEFKGIPRLGREIKERVQEGTKRLNLAEGLIALGIDLSNSIRNQDQTSDSGPTERAMWGKSRMLIHRSMLESLRANVNSAFDKSMSTLGDAEQCLRVSNPLRFRAELGMIDLHRADCRLTEANEVRFAGTADQNSNAISFRQMCLQLYRTSLDFDSLDDPKDVQDFLMAKRLQIWKKHFGKDGPLRSIPKSEGLRRVKSLAHDAMRFLERAEPVLRERRRNVWWTTWFFERRLRTIAALLWCAALEWDKEEPIPFLGLEAKMRKTETAADELLSDAVRMIRVDCYRLATAIEAYAHCARALQLRLKWDAKADPLPERRSKMKELLDKALTQLDGAYERRYYAKDLGLPEAIYIAGVRIEARSVAASLADPLY